MTDLTFNLDSRASFGARLIEIAAAVAACRRWAYAMQARYERLGAGGFQPDAISFETLVSGLEPDRPQGQLAAR